MEKEVGIEEAVSVDLVSVPVLEKAVGVEEVAVVVEEVSVYVLEKPVLVEEVPVPDFEEPAPCCGRRGAHSCHARRSACPCPG